MYHTYNYATMHTQVSISPAAMAPNSEVPEHFWRATIPVWETRQRTTVMARDFILPGPGEYICRYHLGGYGNQVAGSFKFVANFPRKSVNHFETLDVEMPSLNVLREVGMHVSIHLCIHMHVYIHALIYMMYAPTLIHLARVQPCLGCHTDCHVQSNQDLCHLRINLKSLWS
jgi:hypothetical protein